MARIKGTVITKWIIDSDPLQTRIPQLLIDFPMTKYDNITGGVVIPSPNTFVAAFEMNQSDFDLMDADPTYTVLTSEVA